MIRINNVSKKFDDLKVLDCVTHEFVKGVSAAVTGPSGKGKTTLINIMLGLIKPDSGSVEINEGANISCVFQEDRLIEHMTARQNLKLIAPRNADIDGALTALGLDPQNKERVAKYSGGMRRRVAIARAVIAKPDILILDEPFKGLDEEMRAAAAKFVLEECRDACRILITHDPDEFELMGVTDVLNL